MRLPLLILIAVLVLVPNVQAVTVAEQKVLEDPASVRELTVDIEIYGTVEVSGSPTWVGINLTIPQDGPYQDVSLDIGKVEGEHGTEFGLMEGENPGNSFSYRVEGTVNSRAAYTTSLPGTYSIPDEVEKYLLPTENIQSDDPKIRETAEFIVRNAQDDFEKIAKLAIWINENMEYDLSLSDSNYDALTVYEQRRGVCAEYTTLFIAFARSLGYPTRFVSAWAYGKYGWERHAYAEVYLGKWVPVDVLWMEIGYLDATHISFGHYQDNKVKNSVNYRGYDIKNIRWTEDETSLAIKDYTSRDKTEDYWLVRSSDKLRAGDEGIVLLKFTPDDYRVATVDLEPCTGEFVIARVEDKDKDVILRPGEEKIVHWDFTISDNLPENYRLTCPLTLNSKSFALRTVDLEVDTTRDRRMGDRFSANLRSSVIEFGQDQAVYVYPGEFRGTIGVITPEGYETWDSHGPEIRHLFRPRSMGDQEVIVFSSGGQVEKLGYEVKSEVNIYIDGLSAPSHLKAGETGKLRGYVVNTGPMAKSMKLTVHIDGDESTSNILVEDRQEISEDLIFGSQGPKEISVSLRSSDVDLTESLLVNVFEEPEISYDIFYTGGTGKITLDVKNSAAKNVSVRIGSTEREFPSIYGEKEIEIPVQKGEYVLEISFRDLAGNPYDASEKIEFREEDFFSMVNRIINNIIESITGLFG